MADDTPEADPLAALGEFEETTREQELFAAFRELVRYLCDKSDVPTVVSEEILPPLVAWLYMNRASDGVEDLLFTSERYGSRRARSAKRGLEKYRKLGPGKLSLEQILKGEFVKKRGRKPVDATEEDLKVDELVEQGSTVKAALRQLGHNDPDDLERARQGYCRRRPKRRQAIKRLLNR